MTALLEVSGVSVTFDGFRAINNLSFSIDAQELRAIIGPNGAGKTTFVSLLSGRRLPQSGTIRLAGEDITTLPAGLEITGTHSARVTLQEGRYHQIKRMFHRIGCRVETLHRVRIGRLWLPEALKAGEWRKMSAEELVLAASAE